MNARTDSGADLSSTLTSRICHDLVSPIGAIVNGIDLVRELGGAGVDAELAMISQSSDRASALLKYYRVAFGAASDDSAIARGTLRDQAVSFLGSGRIAVKWPGDDGPALSRPAARLLYLLLMCARGLAGMRGVLSVSLPPDVEMPMDVRVEGEFSPDAPEMLAHLSGSAGEVAITPRLVEFALARIRATEVGATPDIDQGDGFVAIRVARPA